MRRQAFIAAGAIALLWPRGARAQSDADPAVTGSVDDYVSSIVWREMSPGWPPAALQAQAICARTYLLQRRSPVRDYELFPSQSDHLYSADAARTAAARGAVGATAGMVLKAGPGLARIAYSSCCGGHTESASDLWGGQPVPYLMGVVCPYCTASPDYRWQVDVPMDAIANAFPQQLEPLGALQSVQVAGSDPSGRARAFELLAQRGSTFVRGNTFRLTVGARTIRSLLVTAMQVQAQAEPTVVIEGGGLGHGVGLCQWGARGMALAGAAVSDVLGFYFPGTHVGSL